MRLRVAFWRTLGVLAWGLLPLVVAAGPIPARQSPLPLIPMPAQVTVGQGRFVVDADTPVVVAKADNAADKVARRLVALLARTRGLTLAVHASNLHAGKLRAAKAITLAIDPQAPVSQAEGYALDVRPEGVTVRARDAAGLFYGAMTLWQLLTPDGGHGAVSVAAVSIRDWPRFRWRGLMLDSARHMQSVATIERLLDGMAEHKLNVFHWHLSDDQGWRLQIRRYPELTRIGAWRTPPGAGTHGEPVRYGGFYTQEQVRQIVAYAAARHITVVPELDMPGHAQAAVASYPHIVGVTGKRPKVSVNWGVNPYLYSPDEQSLHFIENVLDEVMALFPSSYIHVGGDEAIKDQWKASPAVQAQIHRLGLKDEDALQSWFIEQIGQYLQRHGRRLIGWDEILQGGIPASASVMSWRGTDGAIAAARLGHDVVLAPGGSLYFDHLQSDRSDEPSGRYDLLPLARVYAFDPVDRSLTADQAAHVLGTEATLWTELMASGWQLEHALYPRIDALAEIAWSEPATHDWSGFLARLPAQLQRYRALGIAFADSGYAVDIDPLDGVNAALASGQARIRLGNQLQRGLIHYTLDGHEPTVRSPLYRSPFPITLPTTVKARPFTLDGLPLAATRSRVFDGIALRTLQGSQLTPCPGSDSGLRVPLLPDLGTPGMPVYNIDLYRACRLYPAARMDGVTSIQVAAARVPRNFGLAHDQVKVMQWPRQSPNGELEIRLDRCDGPVLARLPLPAGHDPGVRMNLRGRLPATRGIHDLCMRFTAPIDGPLYAIASVQLRAESHDDRGMPTRKPQP